MLCRYIDRAPSQEAIRSLPISPYVTFPGHSKTLHNMGVVPLIKSQMIAIPNNQAENPDM